MSRNEKIHKLANAIRDYRGATDPAVTYWVHPPKLHEIARVRHCLDRLGMHTPENMKTINDFKNYEEFKNWLKEL